MFGDILRRYQMILRKVNFWTNDKCRMHKKVSQVASPDSISRRRHNDKCRVHTAYARAHFVSLGNFWNSCIKYTMLIVPCLYSTFHILCLPRVLRDCATFGHSIFSITYFLWIWVYTGMKVKNVLRSLVGESNMLPALQPHKHSICVLSSLSPSF